MGDFQPVHSPPSGTELERCLRDIVALLALPSLCHARPVADAVRLLADAMNRVLRLDLTWIRLSPPNAHVESILAAGGVSDTLRHELNEAWLNPQGVTQVQLSDLGSLRLCRIPIGFYAEQGTLVLGAKRPGFPERFELVTAQAAASLSANVIENAQLLAKSQEADRRKDEFLALLGHELRNPLAPIITALEIMRRRDPAPSRERQIIERQAHHMVQLVDDLMDISRITRGKLDLDVENLAVRDFVERAVELATPLIERNRHQLVVDVPADLRVQGDPLRLAQVLVNLLTNAAKYTEPGGRIALSAHRDGASVIIRVDDNGRGIDADVIGTIFEPFVQAGRSRSALGGGLGLGLSLVRNLVEQHGGRVTVTSAGTGQGSAFTVSLPAAGPAEAPQAAPSLPPVALNGDQVRVLVVDDNLDAGDLLATALQGSGYDVQVAPDGRAALEAARQRPPQVAILDLGLPEMDGCTLARLLRQEHGDALRLVALTGFADERSRRDTTAAGFEAHLLKPVDLNALMQVLRVP